jgi:hypothetical protein
VARDFLGNVTLVESLHLRHCQHPQTPSLHITNLQVGLAQSECINVDQIKEPQSTLN